MKNTHTVFLQSLLAFPLLLACGDNPPPAAKSPETTVTKAPPTRDPVAVVESVKNSPTASAVNIDPAITKACGLNAGETYFAYDSAQPRAEDAQVLQKVAVCFATGPLKGRTLKLVGHSDPRGGDDYNMSLGLQRADAIAAFVKRNSLPEKQVSTSSRGKIDATGSDETGWAKDRRVDLMLE
jgi:peptidoglycan-associated lipoprotein